MSDVNTQPARPPRRRRRFGRMIRRILMLLVAVLLVFMIVRYWPYLYSRFFGDSTNYVSERFSEVVKEQNRMEVCSITITGQETASLDAFILGTVQQVVIPYSFTVGYFVDYDKATITSEGSTITIAVPEPYADYHKLTVDEANVKKSDFLVPLTTERYSAILSDIESKLFTECKNKQEYQQQAWNRNVENLKSMFTLLLDQLETNAAKQPTIEVVKLPALPDASALPEVTVNP